MDNGTTGFDVLREQLAGDDRSAYVRAMFRRTEDGWMLAYACALVGADSSGWSRETWEYERLSLTSGIVPARDLAVLPSSEPSGVLSVGAIQGAVPGARGPANWTRRPGFAVHDWCPLPWPVTEYSLAALDQDVQLPQGMLAGQSCPSFPGPDSAWRAFFEGDFSLSGTHLPPGRLAVVRFTGAAWLGHVRVGPAELVVEVCGADLAGCELELFGETGRCSCGLDGPGTVAIPLEHGLPDNAWLWLKRDVSWLDYRVIDPRSGWAGEVSRPGVEFEMASDPQADVEALLAAGEGPQVEYKRQLPETAEQKRKVFKTLAAFSTGNGGALVFGMDPDELTVTGLDGDARKLRDHVYDLIGQIVIPPPAVTITHHQVGEKTILVLGVEPGPLPPYGIAVDKGSRTKPEYYIRRGASTYPAQPGDLRDAARSRP